MESRNGFFELSLKPDGTYLILYPAVGDGQPVTYDEINNYLYEKRINDYDIKSLGSALAVAMNQQTEVKLTSTVISPESESVKITITPDRMYAIGRFYPPSGNVQLLTERDITGSLVQAGVKYGLAKENLDAFFQKRKYCEDIILAQGTMSEEGNDAVITYHFNIDNSAKPKLNEDGSVDFHQLDVISSINKGDVLATLVPATQGKAGIDVCGNLITPRKVVSRVLKHGKDIHLSEDGLKMYSDVSGHVMLVDNKVFVSNTYEVLADVDASTGDIIYEGNVTVKGNVITGYMIQAKGDIVINGVVEGATLIAGGQIVLKRGMQGMSKGRMEAEGNIISKFIENSEVKAGGYITTEAILHSKVAAQGDITVGGKKGFITGGEIRSTTNITVKTAGSTMGTNTLLEVGINPAVIEEFHNIEKSISSNRADLDKLLPILTTYKKKISNGEKLPEDRMGYFRLATQNCIVLNSEINELTQRYEILKGNINSNENGSICVQNVAYPGVKIVISNVVHYIKSETHYSKFIRDRADIKIVGL